MRRIMLALAETNLEFTSTQKPRICLCVLAVRLALLGVAVVLSFLFCLVSFSINRRS